MNGERPNSLACQASWVFISSSAVAGLNDELINVAPNCFWTLEI